MTGKTITQGKEVYDRIKSTLTLRFPNQFVTIEPESKEYFVSPTAAGSILKAKSRFPTSDFYTVQIGKDTVTSMKR